MTEHKPCPFCGSEKVNAVEGGLGEFMSIRCPDCHANGPFVYSPMYPTYRDSVARAWELWDERAEDC